MLKNNNMDNNEIKYNPLKDSSFWIAFIFSGGLLAPVLFFSGVFNSFRMIMMITPLIVWETWIIFKKGKKGSLVVGLLISLLVVVVLFAFSFMIMEGILSY